jgi:transcriptional regulator with PAS, ATPase and Fis domain
MSKIIMISPYPQFTELVKQINKETGDDILIFEAILDEGLETARRVCAEENTDVIIGRGATGALLKKNLDIPVVDVEITSFDVLQALNQAKKISSRVGFFAYNFKNFKYDYKAFSEILSIKISPYLYRTDAELELQIKKAVEEGIEVFVGTGVCILKYAAKLKRKGILVYSSRAAIYQAIQNAKNIINIRHSDREKNQLLKTILDYSYEGIIAVDYAGKIFLFNPFAEKILKMNAADVLGTEIGRFNDPASRIWNGGATALGELCRIGDTRLVVNRVPITIENRESGRLITFQDVTQIQNLEQMIRKELYTKGLVANSGLDDICGESQVIARVIAKARKFGHTDSTVLITGESGTGKELFAQGIHKASQRNKGPFVAINCAALPENLLESELFGYEEGAFTGAKKGGKPGLFELAHKGSIFLDEIGEIPVSIQARLLRVLQEKQVMRLGGRQIIPVDVRVIAATNYNLMERLKAGLFREDLFYRLNVLNLHLPPLRERKTDIAILARYFLKEFAKRFDKKMRLSSHALKALMAHSWPGNVRELRNFIEKCVVLCDSEMLSGDFIESLLKETDPWNVDDVCADDEIKIKIGTLEDMEKQIIEKLSEDERFTTKARLAKLLNISRTTLWKKLAPME